MPIYEYLCTECSHRFEYLLLSSSSAANCPACGSLNLEQQISSYAVHSEASHRTNLTAAYCKVAAARGERSRDEHQHLHEHFEDSPRHPEPDE